MKNKKTLIYFYKTLIFAVPSLLIYTFYLIGLYNMWMDDVSFKSFFVTLFATIGIVTLTIRFYKLIFD